MIRRPLTCYLAVLLACIAVCTVEFVVHPPHAASGAEPATGSATDSSSPELPPAANGKIDFHRQVLPIFANRCVTCHARGRAEGGFSLETRSSLLRASDSGQAVVPGNSAQSLLIQLVAGVDPEQVMPKQGRRLSGEEIGVLRAWIDQGVAWDADVSLRTLTLRSWQPRTIELPPAAAGLTHPIDRLMAKYAARHDLKLSAAVDDRTFARRLAYDLVGLPLTLQELQSFVDDPRSDKRDRLADVLLNNKQRYADHWLTFWNDLLRNDYEGTGYIDGGRQQITDWLYAALLENKPYDQLVRDLIEPARGAEGFIKGIVWRGAVNASQRPPLQAAQNLAQVFLGINLKCASCHDSFVSPWKLQDAYGLAGVFSEQRLELFRCDKATGQFAEPAFLNPELGAIDPAAGAAERQKQLAVLMTGKQNGRLRRTMVNRLWARFFGRALVEPVDEIDNPAWNEDLLDWLADDLQSHGDDLKYLMRQIVTSRTYQLPSVGEEPGGANGGAFVFQGPQVRRLTAEQFLDTIWMHTGTGPVQAAANFPAAAHAAPGQPLRGQWIWSYADGSGAVPQPGEQVALRRTFELAAAPREAWAVVTCDNEFTFWVNGQRLAAGADWAQPQRVPLQGALRAGQNEFLILARNAGSSPNPAALFFEASILLPSGDTLSLPSDADWQWTPSVPDDAGILPAEAAQWKPAVPVKNQDFLPGELRDKLAQLLRSDQPTSRSLVRASQVVADSLMRALGRPIRDQVVTTRPDSLTTLEALDLTNGATLAGLLARGANHMLDEHPAWTAQQAARFVFENFLGRLPAPEEVELSAEMIGSPPTREGLADLLWAVVMLPEFQLIR